MARSRDPGNGRLEQALETQIQNQAAFVARMAEADQRMAAHERDAIELRRTMAELERVTAQRFARIEAILLEHSRILQALPDAVRDKVGFKIPPPPRSRREVAWAWWTEAPQ
jgi:hypothetical protein